MMAKFNSWSWEGSFEFGPGWENFVQGLYGPNVVCYLVGGPKDERFTVVPPHAIEVAVSTCNDPYGPPTSLPTITTHIYERVGNILLYMGAR
jgi:hypothetical protein